MKTKGAIAAAILAMLPVFVYAQHSAPFAQAGAGISVGFGHASFSSGSSVVGFLPRVPRRSPTSLVYLGDPFLYDDSYYAPVQQPAPQVVFVPTPSEAPMVETPRAAPLMIELQQGRYVRVGSEPVLDDVASADNPVKRASETRPAILVFRDGRTREVASYAIIDRTMYVAGDYWTTGSWNERIALADLDLPQTLQRNQERGVTFLLPSGPNQIVTRP
jgi:hypothetical protein